MKRVIIAGCILMAGALYSGATVFIAHRSWCDEWERTPAAERENLILGPYASVVRKVRAQIPPEEGFLLVAPDVDPAPLPYALFPRRIWQMQTDTEIMAVFMELPPTPYPIRPPDSLPVSWRLDLRIDNLERGGELTRTNRSEENR